MDPRAATTIAAISASVRESNWVCIRERGTVFAVRSMLSRMHCTAKTIGADLYLAGINPGDNSVHRAKPCPICSRLIIQAGIKNVYLRVGAKAGEYEVVPAKDLVWHL